MEGVQYLEDLCRILPKPWAVVGNGETKLKVGSIIDSYPTVVRFNEYMIEGYEEYVGTKTTLRSVGWAPGTIRDVPMISPFIPKPMTDSWHICEKNKAAGMVIIRPKKGGGRAGFFSTSGYALLRILSREHVDTMVFHMDGLQSGHYWDANHKHWAWHKGSYEWREIQRLPHVGIYTHNFEPI